jgi:glucose-1-phosphate cytidylyltransferase
MENSSKINEEKVLILCGGNGLRIKGYFGDVPKPLITIGDKPIIYYIIQGYVEYGFKNFILLVGKDELAFQEFAMKYSKIDIHIQVLQTGLETPTGGRLLKAKEILKNNNYFCLTYGDGIANINFKELIKFHSLKDKLVTLTAINPQLPFGMLNIESDSSVVSFVEKPYLKSYVNGGFFVVDYEIFNFLEENSDFEVEILSELAKQRQISAFKHSGFWKSVDTYKDYLYLKENIHHLK